MTARALARIRWIAAPVMLTLAAVAMSGVTPRAAAQTTTEQPVTATKASVPVLVQAEDRANLGRIELETDPQARYRIERQGDQVQIRFEQGTKFAALPSAPRNVVAMKANGAILELTLAHGAAVHPVRNGSHIVFDIIDVPNAAKAPAEQPQNGPKPATRDNDTRSADAPAPNPPKRADQPSATSPPSGNTVKPAEPAVRPPVMAASPELGGRYARPVVLAQAAPPAAPAPSAAQGPVALKETAAAPSTDDTVADETPPPAVSGPVARRVRLPPDAAGSAVLLPFDASTGAAAFAVSEGVVIVFDKRQPVSLALLRDDPIFHDLTTSLLPSGTLFQMTLPPDRTLSLALVPQGWRLFVQPVAPRRQGIVPVTEAGRLHLPADLPGAVISLTDPDTGATLLVGTQRRPGQAITIRRRTTQFIMRPTLQGAVVEPIADTLQFVTNPKGFVLSDTRGPLAISPITPALQASIDAAMLTRRLDLPALRVETMRRRLREQFAEAGATPPLSRGKPQREAAETLLGLGFGAEAEGLLRLLAEQDPREAAMPDTEALTGIAAILAGRPAEADGLSDTRLNGTDEIDFWRAVRQAMTDEGSPAAAAVLAGTGSLVLSYPKPIAERLLPLVVETMLLGGEIPPATRLMDARPNDPRLAYARALRKQAEGDTDGALADLDRLAQGRDQSDSTRAAVHAIEVRLKAGQTGMAQAADALEKRLIAWRGDDRELAVRERIAALRAGTGGWRTGLGILREAKTDFPERAAAIGARLETMFGEMLHDDGKTPIAPLDFVATIDENTDLMPRYESDPVVQQALLDRLIALDLPSRAAPVLRKLLAGAATDAAKARYGESLAALLAHEGSNAEALAALEDTETEDTPEDLAEARILTRAEAMSGNGDHAGAIALLNRLATPASAAKRATLQEAAGQWDAAASAWRDALAGTPVPSAGPVSDTAAHLLVRLATATARGGDDSGLAGLREAWSDRIPAGQEANAFRLLTAAPVRGTADLQRSGREVGLAAAVAAGKPGATKMSP